MDRQVLYESANEPRHLDIARDIYGSGVAINWGGEPLLRRDVNQNLVPALASSWRMGENAAYWDFTIRANARWSDGVPITSDDWVFTFRHLASPHLDNPWTWFYYDIKGIQAYKEGKSGADEIGVEAIDEKTLRIRGEGGAIPHLPALMAYMAAVPAPRHKAENNPEHWADSAEGFVSSGPMRLQSWEHNQKLEWDANPFDLSIEDAPSKQDVRHNLNLSGLVDLGYGFTLSDIIITRSGFPYTAVIGSDQQNDGNDDNDRAIIGGTVAERNSFRQPKFFNLDLHLLKGFKITETMRLDLSAEVFNVTRNTNKNFGNDSISVFGTIRADGTFTHPNAGVPLFAPSTARFGGPRQLQLGVRFIF